MTNSEENRNQAKKALADLEEAIYFALYDIQDRGATRQNTIDISDELEFTTPTEVEIVKSILNKLKTDGRVESLGNSGDGWQIPRKSETISSP